MTFSQISGGAIPRTAGGYLNNPLLISDTALTGATTALRSFRLELPRASNSGNGGTRISPPHSPTPIPVLIVPGAADAKANS